MILKIYFLVNLLFSSFLLFGFCVNGVKARWRMGRYDAACGLALACYVYVSGYLLFN